VPEWYFWPFYAILRAFTVDFILPAKLWGVLAMFASILLLFFLTWLDRSPVRSGPATARCSSASSGSWCSTCCCSAVRRDAGDSRGRAQPDRAAYYFAHFLIILPLFPSSRSRCRCPTRSRERAARREEGSRPYGRSFAATTRRSRPNKGTQHMVRIIGFFVGLGFVGVLLIS
jgi:ubiquinol-cytochrome c reductase cytochrome b subunit